MCEPIGNPHKWHLAEARTESEIVGSKKGKHWYSILRYITKYFLRSVWICEACGDFKIETKEITEDEYWKLGFL